MREFYESGGIWMHFVLVAGIAATGLSVAHLRQWRRLDTLVPVGGALLLTMVLAALGVLAGFIEMFAALSATTGPRDALLLRGLAIVLNPGWFGLLWALPATALVTTAAVLRARAPGVRPSGT